MNSILALPIEMTFTNDLRSAKENEKIKRTNRKHLSAYKMVIPEKNQHQNRSFESISILELVRSMNKYFKTVKLVL